MAGAVMDNGAGHSLSIIGVSVSVTRCNELALRRPAVILDAIHRN